MKNIQVTLLPVRCGNEEMKILHKQVNEVIARSKVLRESSEEYPQGRFSGSIEPMRVDNKSGPSCDSKTVHIVNEATATNAAFIFSLIKIANKNVSILRVT